MLLVAGAETSATAMTATFEESRSTEVSFGGADCTAVDERVLSAPSGAYRLRPAEPREGWSLESAEDYEDVATVDAVIPRRTGSRRALVWRVTGSEEACGDQGMDCDPEFDDECPVEAGPSAWETEAVTLEMTYLRRRRVPLFTLREMRSDARLTLSARFRAAWDHGYGKSVRCARRSKYSGRCRFSWFIGDAVYSGSFVSTKRVRRRSRWRADRVHVRNRGSARLVDEYCQVTGGSNCVTRYRIRYG